MVKKSVVCIYISADMSLIGMKFATKMPFLIAFQVISIASSHCVLIIEGVDPDYVVLIAVLIVLS